MGTVDKESLSTYTQAMINGLAMDGGLYIPEKIPYFSPDFISTQFSKLNSYSEFAYNLLSPYFLNDTLHSKLESICEKALNFKIPLKEKSQGSYKKINILELFHGPTGAFKDVGARFLAECFSELSQQFHQQFHQQFSLQKQTVLVATSGDTGSAVAAAFDKKPHIKVIVLYPKGMVSSRQEKLLSNWSDNVQAVCVRGNFDDCQRIVKEALIEKDLKNKHHFISANSINIGRLLPQMIYYAKSSIDFYSTHQDKVSFIIPSGNLGNATAALIAKKMGFPIDKIVLSVNKNSSIVNFFNTGVYTPQTTISTLANAMDVGAPSNMERLLCFYNSNLKEIKKDLNVIQVFDSDIRETIRRGPSEWDEIWCPHTATAVFAYEQLLKKIPDKNWIVVSTAHPAKFETLVESIIQKPVPLPEALQELLERPSHHIEIDPSLEALKIIF
jgi:threonine synthase